MPDEVLDGNLQMNVKRRINDQKSVRIWVFCSQKLEFLLVAYRLELSASWRYHLNFNLNAVVMPWGEWDGLDSPPTFPKIGPEICRKMQ